MKKNTPKYVIGIDFGSTYSAVAIQEIGTLKTPELIKFSNEKFYVPTVLALEEDDEGETKIVAWGDQISEAHKDSKIVSHFKRDIINSKSEEYSLKFLTALKDFLVSERGVALDSGNYITCIAHPAGWREDYVKDLKELVKRAGFPGDKIRTVEEPVAAAYSQILSEESDFEFGGKPENNLVIDFGGGTLDICIVETDFGGTSPSIKDVSDEDKLGWNLGGKDFDDKISEYVRKTKNLSEAYDKEGSWLKHLFELYVRENKECASEKFSSGKDSCMFGSMTRFGGPGGFEVKKDDWFHREKSSFSGIFADLVEKFERLIDRAIKKSELDPLEIDKVILTGGSSGWWFVYRLLEEKFPHLKNCIFITNSPYTDVAVGTAMKFGYGRGRGAERIPGLWLECAYDPKGNNPENWEWRSRICLRKAGKTETHNVLPRKELPLPKKLETQYVFPHRIGFKAYDDNGKTYYAVVEFYARKNFPLKEKIKRLPNMFKKKAHEIADEYTVWAEYNAEDGAVYICVRDVRGREIEHIPLVPRHISYASKFGLGARKAETGNWK